MLIPPAQIDTERLILRMPVMTDAEAIFHHYAQDSLVTRYLIWKPHTAVEETRLFLERCARSWADGNGFPWVVMQKGDGALVGMLDLRIRQFQADLGYVLARAAWGKGYATEMTRAVVNWALAQKEIYRVWATCDIDNLASARVLEKAGMTREGVLRRYMIHPNLSEEPRDSFCYAIVK